MGYTTNSPRVVAVVKHAIEQCADIDINKPRVKHPTNGKRYHFHIVAVCKEWVAGERAYKEKIDNLTDVAEVIVDRVRRARCRGGGYESRASPH
jgi:hypothetical protein